jgi:hypothetical protein
MSQKSAAQLYLLHCPMTSGNTGQQQAGETKLRTDKPHHPAHILSFNNNSYKHTLFIICRRLHKVATSDYQLRRSRVQQLDSHWTGVHETSYVSVIRKSVEKTEVSLKSDKNNWYFT